MRAGVAIDNALKAAGRAIGPLTYMWVKESVSRSILEQALKDLEDAASFIRSVLPPPSAGDYSANPPGEDSIHED